MFNDAALSDPTFKQQKQEYERMVREQSNSFKIAK